MLAGRRHAKLTLILSAAPTLFGSPALAQEAVPTQAQDSASTPSAPDSQADIVVTANRRSGTVQSTPINISAVTGDQIAATGVANLREISRSVPGLYIPDQGGRNSSPIIFRGLNATGLGSGDNDNSGGGTVATYVGEVPLYIDLRLKDLDRVEFLAGPQGTLYGAGSLGGAVRYIPAAPRFDGVSGQVRGDVYGYSHGGSPSGDVGLTLNLPLSDTFAFRGSLDRLQDEGFIDQPFVVRTPGVSNPDPNFANPDDVKANLRRAKDVNTDHVTTGRAALRWRPDSRFDATLSYFYQREATNGRQASSHVLDNFPVPIGRYDFARRVEEPNVRTNQLVSLEVNADLDFATLTSATGRSWFKSRGERDQTDLLIGLDFGYELFPTFTATTDDRQRDDNFSQELRLVSRPGGRLNWIVGAFYSDRKTDQYLTELTPGYSQFLVASDPATYVQTRPDNLEYVSSYRSRLREVATYGELSYKITDAWQITGGARSYHYTLQTSQATDTPLYNTVTDATGPDAISLTYTVGRQRDNGVLFKLNTSYTLARDILLYATFSQGYRAGNSNAVAACPNPLPPNQIVCALPNELEYQPDRTNNYEIGLKSQWFDRRLTANLSVYRIDWRDPHLASVTRNGLQPIVVNGGGARTQGLELSLAARPTSRLTMRGTYTYTDPTLTAFSPSLVPYITPPGFQNTIAYADGLRGDRLPGSPRHSGSVYVDYRYPLANEMTLVGSYGVTAQSDVFSTVGNRGGAYRLQGFALHSAQVRLEAGKWTAGIYADNLFNRYAEVGVNATPAYAQTVPDVRGGVHAVRSFYTYVKPPRRIGLRITRNF